jgi:TonB family protein
MSSNFQIVGHFQEGLAKEPLARPAARALLLHCGLVIAIVLYGVIGGFFHHNLWGGAGPGGAIQVTITSAIPLPSDHPPNENVLATEKPSEAPAPPESKQKQAEDETAIPILGKAKKPQQEEIKKTPQRQPESVPQNRAQYGEQAGTAMPRVTSSGSGGPASVDQASFGSINQWYVDQINRTMGANWYKPGGLTIPRGARTYIVFRISRDGSVSDQKLMRSSGNAVLDESCVRAAQRVDHFPPLPSDYRFGYVMIDYYCEY